MGKAKVTELKKVDVDFVSFVNEGANGMKFQIFKSKNFNDKSRPEPPQPKGTKPASAEMSEATGTARPKKARYTMRELIENIVRGMFVDSKQPPAQPDAKAGTVNEQTTPAETAKETQPMNEIQQSITAMRDDIIAAITGLRAAILAVAAPSVPNGQSDPDVTFSKDEKAQGTAAVNGNAAAPQSLNIQSAPTSEQPAAAAINGESDAASPPEASKRAETTTAPPSAKPDEITALSGVVMALSKQVESLAGRIEIMAKERGLSNAIAESGDISQVRREVRKNAAGREIPDFTNIF